MLDLRPFAPSTFGAEIHGLDLGCELSDAVMGEILDTNVGRMRTMATSTISHP